MHVQGIGRQGRRSKGPKQRLALEHDGGADWQQLHGLAEPVPSHHVRALALRACGPSATPGVGSPRLHRGKEMDDGGEAVEWRIDGHMCQIWHRARAVEYRVEPRAAKFEDRRNNLGRMADKPSGQNRKSLRGL
jgi:hypothetical protein